MRDEGGMGSRRYPEPLLFRERCAGAAERRAGADGRRAVRRRQAERHSGQFVNVSAQGVSERDLAFAIAFLVKTPPETLAKQIVAGELVTADEQVKAYGEISGEGSLADFAKLTLTGEEAKALRARRRATS